MATIRKRGNSYQIRVSCGYNAVGEQIIKTTTYKPTPGMTEKQIKKEVARQAILFEEKCRNGLQLNSHIKLTDYMEKWFADYATQNLKAKTLERYTILSQRVNSALGHIHLDKIQPHHLIEFYKNLQEENIRLDTKYKAIKDIRPLLTEKGLTQAEFCATIGVGLSVMRVFSSGGNVSAETAEKIQSYFDDEQIFEAVEDKKTLSNATVKYYHAFLSSMFSTAVEWQILIYNPCARVKPPKVERAEAVFMDEKETALLFEKLQNEPLQFNTIITLLIFSGMRRGEILGLEWSDIDFKNNLISITKTSLYTPKKGIYADTPKNKTSERTIKVPASCIALLKEHKQKQFEARILMGDQWKESGKIFTQRNGLPMHPDTLTAQFKRFIAKNNLPDIHIHTLRHTNATLLIANGTDIRTVAKRLGHATATTTANIYAHAIRTADEMASDTLDDIFFSKAK